MNPVHSTATISVKRKMANPKYAGLPGIAPPDEKDVYETDDLPEADQDPEFSEAESENIERPHLNITSAHSRFKDKTLICGKDVDFSDKYRRKRHTGYYAVSEEWDIAGEGEQETILQRCNRLQCEFRQLLEDINKLKENESEESNKELALVEPMVPKLQQSLQQINTFTNTVDEDFMKFLSDPHETQVRGLLSKLEQLKEVGSSNKKSSGSEQNSNDSVVTYHLTTLPAKNKFVQTARLANLEQRINKLETVIGTTPENLNRLALSEYKSLMQASREIGARVFLLDPAQIEKAEKKLEGVLSKLDSLAEKRGGPEMIERMKKIDELFETLAKTSLLTDSATSIMERLIALKSLHMEAVEFKRSLKQLETDIVNAGVTLTNNEAVLNIVKDSLEKHLTTAEKNIQSFDERLKALMK